MRRYWQRIDYSKIKKQDPHKQREFQKTKFDDVPLSEFNFDGLPDEIIRMIFRRKRKLQNRVLFFEKNYIKIENYLQKNSKKKRKFKFYRKFHIIYFLYLIYYNLDALLYFFQLFFGFFGDKKFRKFVRKIAFFRYFRNFRLVLYNILYYSISLPIRFFIYQKFYRFIRFVFHKRWLQFKQKLWFEIEDRTSKLRGNFWYDYQQKVNEKNRKMFATYFEMYTYPYTIYYKGWRKWVVRFRESGAFFIIEFQDLYAYFAGLSFVTWVVEFYYIIYNVIFFFYPFVIPILFFIPFLFITKYFLEDMHFIDNFNSIFFISFCFYLLFIVFVFILLATELTKYYLVKMSVEAVNWYSLNFIAKIRAIFSCFKYFFFRTRLHEINLKRIKSRFFYYHALTRHSILADKNIANIAKDENRKDFFLKRAKLYPKFPARSWCQYGKCLYKKQILGFGYIKNIFAGYSLLNKIDRKTLNYNSNVFFSNLIRLNIFDFFLFFYNFVFLKFSNFFTNFFGLPKIILVEFLILLFFLSSQTVFLFYIIFLLILVFLFIYYTYNKYYIQLEYSRTLDVFFREKLNTILYFYIFLKSFFFLYWSFFLVYFLIVNLL